MQLALFEAYAPQNWRFIILYDDTEIEDAINYIIKSHTVHFIKIEECALVEEDNLLSQILKLVEEDYFLFMDDMTWLAPMQVEEAIEAGKSSQIICNFSSQIKTAECIDAKIDLLLSVPCNHADIYGKIFSTKFIIGNNLHFKFASHFNQLKFLFLAFCLAGTVKALLPCQSGLRIQSFRPIRPLEHLPELIDFIRSMVKYFGIGTASSQIDHFLKAIFKKLLPTLAKDIKSCPGFLEERILKRFSLKPELFDFILSIYADLATTLLGANPLIAISEVQADVDKFTPPFPADYEEFLPRSQNPAPLISIIIPNYNKAAYIEHCLESVLTQSYADFEVIIVDDHSTDGSFEFAFSKALEDKRIRLFRLARNSLQGRCRNIGISKARGQYIVFVDSDDRLSPDFLNIGLSSAKKENTDIVFFAWQQLYENGRQKFKINRVNKIIGADEIRAAYRSGEISGVPWGSFFSASFIRSSGCRFAEGVYHQDQHFMGKIVQKAHKVAFVDYVGYSVIESLNSTVRPAARRYLHIHSPVALFAHYDALIAADPTTRSEYASHFSHNIERIFLPGLKAFKDYHGRIVLSRSDRESLVSNSSFLHFLFSFFADRWLAYQSNHPVHSRDNSNYAPDMAQIAIFYPATAPSILWRNAENTAIELKNTNRIKVIKYHSLSSIFRTVADLPELDQGETKFTDRALIYLGDFPVLDDRMPAFLKLFNSSDIDCLLVRPSGEKRATFANINQEDEILALADYDINMIFIRNGNLFKYEGAGLPDPLFVAYQILAKGGKVALLVWPSNSAPKSRLSILEQTRILADAQRSAAPEDSDFMKGLFRKRLNHEFFRKLAAIAQTGIIPSQMLGYFELYPQARDAAMHFLNQSTREEIAEYASVAALLTSCINKARGTM